MVECACESVRADGGPRNQHEPACGCVALTMTRTLASSPSVLAGRLILREATDTYAARGAPLDLDALFAALGVGIDERRVELRDDAPRAVTRQISTSVSPRTT